MFPQTGHFQTLDTRLLLGPRRQQIHDRDEHYAYGDREESFSPSPIAVSLFFPLPTKAKGKISSHLLVASVCGYNELSLFLFSRSMSALLSKKKKEKISLTMVAGSHDYLQGPLWPILLETPFQRGCIPAGVRQQSLKPKCALDRKGSPPHCRCAHKLLCSCEPL